MRELAGCWLRSWEGRFTVVLATAIKVQCLEQTILDLHAECCFDCRFAFIAKQFVTPSSCCRDFSLVDGHCFKALFVGKSNTLNYYQSMNQTNPENVGI